MGYPVSKKRYDKLDLFLLLLLAIFCCSIGYITGNNNIQVIYSDRPLTFCAFDRSCVTLSESERFIFDYSRPLDWSDDFREITSCIVERGIIGKNGDIILNVEINRTITNEG